MPTAKDFAREVEALALTVTGYQTGKSGQNGLCDCIGLIMGAMTRLGRGSYPMHSTNYFARYQMSGLRELVSNVDELQIGQLLYKARSDTSDLNVRYQPGGRYYTGDMLDYYHVGVVTGINPLEITHCTQDGSISGIKRDSSARGWTHVGEFTGVDYATTNDEYIEEDTMSKTAYVSVPAGTSTANLRTRPSKTAPLVKRVKAGTVVDVLEQADGWAKITTPEGDTGYMMLEFLKSLEHAEAVGDEPAQHVADNLQTATDTPPGEITLTLPKSAAQALYEAFQKAGWA